MIRSDARWLILCALVMAGGCARGAAGGTAGCTRHARACNAVDTRPVDTATRRGAR